MALGVKVELEDLKVGLGGLEFEREDEVELVGLELELELEDEFELDEPELELELGDEFELERVELELELDDEFGVELELELEDEFELGRSLAPFPFCESLRVGITYQWRVVASTKGLYSIG